MADRELTNKVVVITGASSGFGKGSALRFAEKGASVVLAARRGELLDELAQKCEGTGVRALAVPTDVSQQDDMESLAEQTVSAFGRIDVWVNNAGAGAVGRFEDIPLADHVQVIETHLLGTLYGSYFAMRQFRRQGDGILINIASVIGKVPSPYFSSYAAAKHGVVGLSATLRQELSEDGIKSIRVCTVEPTTLIRRSLNTRSNTPGAKQAPFPLHTIPRGSWTRSSVWRQTLKTKSPSAPPLQFSRSHINSSPVWWKH